MKNNTVLIVAVILLLSVILWADVQGSSSENTLRLKELLERYPQADLDKDGVLTKTEAEQYRDNNRIRQMQQKNGDNSPAAEQRLRAKELRSQIQGKQGSEARPEIVPLSPTQSDVRYGDHPRNVLDFYRANSNEPTPVVIYFHGGGFSQGDKSDVNNSTLCRRCLDMGISVVSANYRFVIGENAEPFPGPMHDGARVVQFVRFMASEWGIDPERVVLAGASAGACLSIWLAVHDDLAEPESEDPVEKLSTRVSGVIAYGGQTFLDPNLILEKVGGTPDIHRSILPFYGVETMAELDKPEVQALIHDASAINHVSPDDPPLQLRYKGGLGDIPLPEDAPGSDSIHHPFFGKVMQEKYRSAGLVCDFFCADERGSRNELEFLKFCFASHR